MKKLNENSLFHIVIYHSITRFHIKQRFRCTDIMNVYNVFIVLKYIQIFIIKEIMSYNILTKRNKKNLPWPILVIKKKTI